METGGELGFRFGQVEWCAVGFRHHCNGEDKEGHEAKWEKLEKEPDMLSLLGLHNLNHAQRSNAVAANTVHPQPPRLVMRTAETTARPIATS